jgi:hypothetical protein
MRVRGTIRDPCVRARVLPLGHHTAGCVFDEDTVSLEDASGPSPIW